MIHSNKLLFNGNGNGKFILTLSKINENIKRKGSFTLQLPIKYYKKSNKALLHSKKQAG